MLFSASLCLFTSSLPSSHLYMSTILFLLMIQIPPWCHREINPQRIFTQQKNLLQKKKRIACVSFRQDLNLDSWLGSMETIPHKYSQNKSIVQYSKSTESLWNCKLFHLKIYSLNAKIPLKLKTVNHFEIRRQLCHWL